MSNSYRPEQLINPNYSYQVQKNSLANYITDKRNCKPQYIDGNKNFNMTVYRDNQNSKDNQKMMTKSLGGSMISSTKSYDGDMDYLNLHEKYNEYNLNMIFFGVVKQFLEIGKNLEKQCQYFKQFNVDEFTNIIQTGVKQKKFLEEHMTGIDYFLTNAKNFYDSAPKTSEFGKLKTIIAEQSGEYLNNSNISQKVNFSDLRSESQDV